MACADCICLDLYRDRNIRAPVRRVHRGLIDMFVDLCGVGETMLQNERIGKFE
jgi:hypothetical protein